MLPGATAGRELLAPHLPANARADANSSLNNVIGTHVVQILHDRTEGAKAMIGTIRTRVLTATNPATVLDGQLDHHRTILERDYQDVMLNHYPNPTGVEAARLRSDVQKRIGSLAVLRILHAQPTNNTFDGLLEQVAALTVILDDTSPRTLEVRQSIFEFEGARTPDDTPRPLLAQAARWTFGQHRYPRQAQAPIHAVPTQATPIYAPMQHGVVEQMDRANLTQLANIRADARRRQMVYQRQQGGLTMISHLEHNVINAQDPRRATLQVCDAVRTQLDGTQKALALNHPSADAQRIARLRQEQQQHIGALCILRHLRGEQFGQALDAHGGGVPSAPRHQRATALLHWLRYSRDALSHDTEAAERAFSTLGALGGNEHILEDSHAWQFRNLWQAS